MLRDKRVYIEADNIIDRNRRVHYLGLLRSSESARMRGEADVSLFPSILVEGTKTIGGAALGEGAAAAFCSERSDSSDLL